MSQVTGHSSQLFYFETSKLQTSKPVLNVALSSPTGYRMSHRLVWVSSLTPPKPGYALVVTMHAKQHGQKPVVGCNSTHAHVSTVTTHDSCTPCQSWQLHPRNPVRRLLHGDDPINYSLLATAIVLFPSARTTCKCIIFVCVRICPILRRPTHIIVTGLFHLFET